MGNIIYYAALGIAISVIFYFLRKDGREKTITIVDGKEQIKTSYQKSTQDEQKKYPQDDVRYIMKVNPKKKFAAFMLIGFGILGFGIGIAIIIRHFSIASILYSLVISLPPFLLGAYSLMNIYNYKITYDLQKIELINSFEQKMVMHWKDVDSIEQLNGLVSAIKITGKDGKSIKVSEQLIGFDEFENFLSSNFAEDDDEA